MKTWRTLVCVVALAISACTNQPHLVVKPADSALVPQPLPTGPLGSFLGAHLLTTTEGWVLTDNYLLWTANGGRTWSNITPSLQRSARKIQTVFFLDPKLGWIVTSSGVLHTTDGGATWRTSPLPALLPTGRPAGPLQLTYSAFDVGFVDPLHGWIRFALGGAGENQVLIADPPFQPAFRTDDGGRSWKSVPVPHLGSFRATSAADAWSALAGGGLTVTHDGGASWQPVSLPVPASHRSDYVSITLPTFLDQENAVLPALYYTDTNSVAVFYVTSDSGRSWHAVAPLPDPAPHPFGQDQGMASSISRDVWAALFRNDLAVSTDGGLHWNAFKPAGVEWLTDVDFETSNLAWGMGTFRPCAQCDYTSGPLQSVDGGRTWTPLTFAPR